MKTIKVKVGKLRKMINEESKLNEQLDTNNFVQFGTLIKNAHKKLESLWELYDSGDELIGEDAVKLKRELRKSLVDLHKQIPGFMKELK